MRCWAASTPRTRTPLEVEAGDRTYALLPVDVPEFGFVNVYGTDVTAVRERERLARENERLLLNILPAPIAQRLRKGPGDKRPATWSTDPACDDVTLCCSST